MGVVDQYHDSAERVKYERKSTQGTCHVLDQSKNITKFDQIASRRCLVNQII